MCTHRSTTRILSHLPPPPADGKSKMAQIRLRLLALRNDLDSPFPKQVAPQDFAVFLRAQTRVPASYAAMVAVAIIRAGSVRAQARPRSYSRVCATYTTLTHPTVNDAYSGRSDFTRPLPCLWYMGDVPVGHLRYPRRCCTSTHRHIRRQQDHTWQAAPTPIRCAPGLRT